MSFTQSPTACWSPEPRRQYPMRAAPSFSRLQVHRRDDDRRDEIEWFVADIYRRYFGARLTQFMPVLVSRSIDGQPCAAAGYRSAAEPLFLERYLTEPIDRLLSRATGRTVARDDVVEIGQFAARYPGDGRGLMPELAQHLVDSGFRWAVITATSQLRRLLRHQGLSALPIGVAEPHRLGDEARCWGSYYRHAPRVLAGDLVASLACLRRGRR